MRKVVHRRNRIAFCLVLLLTFDAVPQDTKENSEFKLAVNLYNSRMYDLAADQFQNFINAYPGTANSVEARFYLGLTQVKQKKFDEARVTFQNFALAYVDNAKAPEAWMRVGDAYVALGNDREAASAYERVKVFHPASPLAPEALVRAATYYRRAGAKDNARKAYRTIIQDYAASSSVPAARLGMGELYLEEGRTELAQAEFSRVIETTPDPGLKARGTLLLAKLYLSTGRTEEAEGLLNRISTSHKATSSFAPAAYELGRLFAQSGKNAEAVEQFRKAIADTSAELSLREQALFEMGNAFAAGDDQSSALKEYERLLSMFPAGPFSSIAHYRAGRAAAASRNFQNALGHFRKAAASGDNNANGKKALAAIGETAIRLRDFSSAAGAYSAYLDKFPGDPWTPEILLRLGSLYENELKDVRRAAGFYEDVFKFPGSYLADDALFALGRCREKLGEFEAALAAYSELREQYPSSDFVPQATEQREFLQNHKIKDRDAGLEKLALLMGEMLTDRSRATLAFQLGQIYFHDLKDYGSAAKQFTAAIDAGLDQDQLAEAGFFRARSFHLVSDVNPSATKNAIVAYDDFLKQFPASKWTDDAAFSSFELRSKGKAAAEVIPLALQQMAAKPASTHRAKILLTLGAAYSANAKPVDAVQTFRSVTREFPNSPSAASALLQLGKLHQKLSQPDSADKALTTLVAKFPRSPEAAEGLWSLAEFKMSQKKPAETIDQCRRLLSDHFYSSYALRANQTLADAYLESGNVDDAITHIQTLWERENTTPFEGQTKYDLLFKLATAYSRKGDRQKAVELYNAYLLHDRKSAIAADALFALGTIARDQGRVESASAYFKQAAALSGQKSTREIADLLFQTEQYAEADRQYAQLAKNAKNDTDKQYFQSRAIITKFRLGDVKDADPLLRDFEKTYKRKETAVAELLYEKGLHYFRNQEYVNASKILERVVDDYEETRFGAWAEFYRGKIFEATNKTPDAVKKYESILKRYPKSDVVPRIHLSLGNINYNAEKYQDAITHYQRVVKAPEAAGDILPFAMGNLIEAYEAVQLWDAALKVTRDFIDFFPKDPGATDKQINIGVLYTRLGYYDQSIVHLQNLLNETGSDLEAEIRYAIGEAHYYKGDYQQAILEFLKVPYLVTRQGKIDWTATSFYMAGQAYEKMSKFDQAIAMYQQIIDRPGIDGTFKAAAKKEIDRVKTVTKKGSK